MVSRTYSTDLRTICEANCKRDLAAIRAEREKVRKQLEAERNSGSTKRYTRLR